jgi:hypothetical protein
MREPMTYRLIALFILAACASPPAPVTIATPSSNGIAPVGKDFALTIEALSADGIAAPIVRHHALRVEVGQSICSASETAWASRLAPHDALVLCLPTSWNGSGEVGGRLAISTPFGDAKTVSGGEFFYHAEAPLKVRGSRSSITIDVPALAMTGIGLGAATELGGMRVDARVRGELALVR